MTHIYRNRPDDYRATDQLHYCEACDGWYGVPHRGSHCQQRQPSWHIGHCACRFCCERDGRPIEGQFGEVLP